MEMGKRLKMARKAKKMNQTEFAKKLGVTMNFISLMERGKSKVPLERLKDIVEILELNKLAVTRTLVLDYKEKIRGALK